MVFCRGFPSLSTWAPVILRRRTLASRRCHSAAEAFPGATMTGKCDMRLQWQDLWIDGRHFPAFSRRTLVALVNPTETFYHFLEPPSSQCSDKIIGNRRDESCSVVYCASQRGEDLHVEEQKPRERAERLETTFFFSEELANEVEKEKGRRRIFPLK